MKALVGEVVLDMVIADIQARTDNGELAGVEGKIAIEAINDFKARAEEGAKKSGDVPETGHRRKKRSSG